MRHMLIVDHTWGKAGLWSGNCVRMDVTFGFAPSVRKQCVEGQLDEALQTVDLMHERGICVSTNIFYYLLEACIKRKDLSAGREVDCLILRSGLETSSFLGSHMIRLFALCGSLLEARDIFDKLSDPTLYTWSAIILAYANFGHGEHAIELFHQMQQSGVKPGEYSLVAILKACSAIAAVDQGKQIHAYLLEIDFELGICVGNSLVDLYCKCGSLEDAQRVFHSMKARDVVTWSALIAGHARHGNGQEALCLFHQMQREGIEPNDITFVCILKACSSTAALDQGRLVHLHAVKIRCELDAYVESTLIDMYAKCGSLEDACRVFDEVSGRTVVTWSAMISGCALYGRGEVALQLYHDMQQEGVRANNVTYGSVLKACAIMAAFNQGKWMHSHIIESGCGLDVFIGNTLIDMYGSCGSLNDARNVFNSLPRKDVVTWNAMMMGYVQHGCCPEALRLFQQMQLEAMEPDNCTFIILIKACSGTASLDKGKLIHFHAMESGWELDLSVGSALIDTYVKYGSLWDAHEVFNKMSKPDEVAWSAMIMGYAHHNDYKLALKYFQDMQLEGLRPNVVTFVCLLCACSHAGLVIEGGNLFRLMTEGYGLSPATDHYNCLVDLLGRVGFLSEAEDLLETMPCGSNIIGWTSLLNHCQMHGNTYLGRRCFDHVAAMDAGLASGFVLMSKLYVDSGMLDDADKICELGNYGHAWKKPGMSFVEFQNEMNVFVIADKTHPESDDMFATLRALSVQLKGQGYVPHFNGVLQCHL